MTTSDQLETPSQKLARQIVERLVGEKLISAEAANTLQPKLADGTLRAEDWKLPIELRADKEAPNEQ
ncbi:MAG: hypothetical protein M3R61_12565 [Chloroflexota bacterium]|nr:hypothetical protein [Chloroflexota bacterium]